MPNGNRTPEKLARLLELLEQRRSLLIVMQDNPDVPVALICARGARSFRVTLQLAAFGITDIVDVPEGMLGSAAGPGWLSRGLPTVAFTG